MNSRVIWMVVMAALSLRAEDRSARLAQLFDGKLNATQRANACYALRGDADAEVIRAMARAMEKPDLLSCAAENLRIAKAVDALRASLKSGNAETRAAAARELGAFLNSDGSAAAANDRAREAELMKELSEAAQDENALVASNALVALDQVNDARVVPYLAPVAKKGGMIGDMALDRILQVDAKTAVEIARPLLATGQVPDKLYAMRTIGAAGDRSDLEALKKIAATPGDAPAQRTRGFGFMPPVNLARAAQAAIAEIEVRGKGE